MLIKEALPRLGDDVVMVSIDSDTREDAELLRRYADDLELPWRFATAPRELMSSLAGAFGPEFLYPPSDPMVIVSPNGVARRLPSGVKDEDDLRAAVERERGRT